MIEFVDKPTPVFRNNEPIIREAIREVLLTRDEAYSVDFWEEWKKHGGDTRKHNALSKVQTVLKKMEKEGLLQSREVKGSEHGQSQLLRRYYRLVDVVKSGRFASTPSRANPPRMEDWGKPREVQSDDLDIDDVGGYRLSVFMGGNGDWYITILKPGDRLGPCVRLSTSGGASASHPGLPAAIADVYRALDKKFTYVESATNQLEHRLYAEVTKQRAPENATRPCPSCGKEWITDASNLHPDECLSCGWKKPTCEDENTEAKE